MGFPPIPWFLAGISDRSRDVLYQAAVVNICICIALREAHTIEEQQIQQPGRNQKQWRCKASLQLENDNSEPSRAGLDPAAIWTLSSSIQIQVWKVLHHSLHSGKVAREKRSGWFPNSYGAIFWVKSAVLPKRLLYKSQIDSLLSSPWELHDLSFHTMHWHTGHK